MAAPPTAGPAAAPEVPQKHRRIDRSTGRPARRRGLRRLLSFWPQYVAVSPFFLLFLTFLFFPMIYSLYLAFQRWDGIGEKTFVGFDQFRFLLDDPTFWLALRNTLVIWVFATFPMLFMALVLATLLNSTRRLTSFYRVAYFVPNVTSVVAVSIFFFSAFSDRYGVVNAVLQAVNVPSVPWLNNEWTIKAVIAMLMTWQWTGYNMIIYLAGLQAIPSDVYEAAKLDGAGPVRTFFSITVPMMRPIILFTVIISTVNGLQSFTEPQVLFGSNAANNPNSGGPGQAGLTTLLYFYHQAFDNNNFGYAAAIVWAFFLVILLFVVINWRVVQGRRKV
ncbi:sugar ABC transporter permease [Streptomyces pseudoechinosporeus]